MKAVQIEQKSYEMPPRDGFTLTYFITVANIDRSADFYERVFGGRVLSRGDGKVPQPERRMTCLAHNLAISRVCSEDRKPGSQLRKTV